MPPPSSRLPTHRHSAHDYPYDVLAQPTGERERLREAMPAVNTSPAVARTWATQASKKMLTRWLVRAHAALALAQAATHFQDLARGLVFESRLKAALSRSPFHEGVRDTFADALPSRRTPLSTSMSQAPSLENYCFFHEACRRRRSQDDYKLCT